MAKTQIRSLGWGTAASRYKRTGDGQETVRGVKIRLCKPEPPGRRCVVCDALLSRNNHDDACRRGYCFKTQYQDAGPTEFAGQKSKFCSFLIVMTTWGFPVRICDYDEQMGLYAVSMLDDKRKIFDISPERLIRRVKPGQLKKLSAMK